MFLISELSEFPIISIVLFLYLLFLQQEQLRDVDLKRARKRKTEIEGCSTDFKQSRSGMCFRKIYRNF